MPHLSTVKSVRIWLSATALTGALAVLAACASVPPSHTTTPLSPDKVAASQSLAGQTGQWPDQAWWRGFNDPQLNSLMDEALANSPDLAAAQARLDKAEAVEGQVKAAMDADLTLNASASSTKGSLNMGTPNSVPGFSGFSPKDLLPHGYWNLGRISLDANYDLDLWGKSHAALKAALGETKAAELDAAVARSDITAGLARAYVELNRLYDQRDDLADLKRGSDIKVDLVQARVDHHVDGKDALLLAQDEQQQIAGRIAAIDNQIRLQGNEIAVLVGAGPDRALSITRPQLAPIDAETLPADVRLNLLARRPDVQAAMQRVEAQGQGIKYAKADFYPDLKLNAYFGTQALSKGGFQDLFDDGSQIAGIGPAFSLPLFHQGRLNAEYRGYEADYNAAVATYDKTLLTALQQVADAAGQSQATAAEIQAAQTRVDAAQSGYELSKARFGKGLASKIDVLTAHSRLIAMQSALSDLKAQAYADRITFLAALGGGYSQ